MIDITAAGAVVARVKYYADAERVGDRGDFKKVVRKFMRKVMQREEKNKNPTFTEKKQRNITKYIDEWFTQNYSWANYLLNNPDGDDTSDGGDNGWGASSSASDDDEGWRASSQSGWPPLRHSPWSHGPMRASTLPPTSSSPDRTSHTVTASFSPRLSGTPPVATTTT